MSEPTRSTPAKPGAAKIREVNDTIRYAMWSVFAVAEPLAGEDRDALATEVEELFTDLAERDVVVRGTYDVAGLRADADVMVWWHAETIEALQEAYHALLRTDYGQHLDPVWSVAALHLVTTVTGSALLALALWRGALDSDEVWAAAHVDDEEVSRAGRAIAVFLTVYCCVASYTETGTTART